MKQTVTVKSHLYLRLQLNLRRVSKYECDHPDRQDDYVRVLRVVWTVPRVDFNVLAVTQFIGVDIVIKAEEAL
ncbi:unnamed protein product [Aspergillus oryzae]|uniref:Unnamed protein product n=2 Tax=Aspergillus oryzae TaxID=5062 RepID=A0AAN4YQ11_ASPOZ|nr:unnamed protein product [Aspergillus oryzae]GMF84071.1 unnamed protein product [Aspergillus oryzae]GMG01552.1 unnamed protein product [Aspergillus oryzae]GMG33931.1 unnamed protein product [Aspergillus oryzae]GMG42467.1 unnamed protein product [Aspergillus oryzae var. brunneus]